MIGLQDELEVPPKRAKTADSSHGDLSGSEEEGEEDDGEDGNADDTALAVFSSVCTETDTRRPEKVHKATMQAGGWEALRLLQPLAPLLQLPHSKRPFRTPLHPSRSPRWCTAL
jgi:hypothetical protein